MQFQEVDPDENFDVLKKVSETGQWEIGLTQMIFGRRVRLSRKGECWCVIDYCAGSDEEFQQELLTTVEKILDALPETMTEREVTSHFPPHHLNSIKPINNDDFFWGLVKERAGNIHQFKEEIHKIEKERLEFVKLEKEQSRIAELEKVLFIVNMVMVLER